MNFMFISLEDMFFGVPFGATMLKPKSAKAHVYPEYQHSIRMSA